MRGRQVLVTTKVEDSVYFSKIRLANSVFFYHIILCYAYTVREQVSINYDVMSCSYVLVIVK